MEQVSVADKRRDAGKVHSVSQSEGSRKKQGRVCLVGSWVDGVLGCKDPASIIYCARIVQDAVLRDWHILAVPDTTIVESRDDDPAKEYYSDTGVGKSVPGTDQRAVVERIDLTPIKCEPCEREA